MKPTPQALALVRKLTEQGRAGEKPFGIPLAVWLQEIAKEETGPDMGSAMTSHREAVPKGVPKDVR